MPAHHDFDSAGDSQTLAVNEGKMRLRASSRIVPAVSTEEAISFRQIHEPSGTPIRLLKGVHDGDTFTEVADEEIVKGYEYAKGQHVLIDPKEIDELKLERASLMRMRLIPAIGRSPIT